MKHPRFMKPNPATLLATAALVVAIGGTALNAQAGAPSTAAQSAQTNSPRGSVTPKVGAVVASSASPLARASKALGTRRLVYRKAATTLQGNRSNDANYGGSAVAVQCGPGETAISSGTNFPGIDPNYDVTTRYNRLTVSGKRGRPTGALAVGATDTSIPAQFEVYVLCAG